MAPRHRRNRRRRRRRALCRRRRRRPGPPLAACADTFPCLTPGPARGRVACREGLPPRLPHREAELVMARPVCDAGCYPGPARARAARIAVPAAAGPRPHAYPHLLPAPKACCPCRAGGRITWRYAHAGAAVCVAFRSSAARSSAATPAAGTAAAALLACVAMRAAGRSRRRAWRAGLVSGERRRAARRRRD